jgi:hypothetical protein
LESTLTKTLVVEFIRKAGVSTPSRVEKPGFVRANAEGQKHVYRIIERKDAKEMMYDGLSHRHEWF